jgi:putative endonuclease
VAGAVQNMFYTYILKSLKHGRHYTGSTNNLDARLNRHYSRRNKATKSGVPWKIVYYEKFGTRSEAMKREVQIKKLKSGIAFKKLVNT